jgi:hypothetical protein
MRRVIHFMLIYLTAPCLLIAADNEGNGFEISYGGFIKNDFFYDSRQSVTLREGHFLLWPKNHEYDEDGTDINDASGFNFLSIQTRLNVTVTAPEYYGIKTTGHVEGAFFGNAESDINGFRLRHAFVRFERKQSQLLFGQFWNPLLLPVSFPDVVSFNTGCPFQPFSRNPQIRFTQKAGNFSFIAAALSQRDFSSVGPQGRSSSYLSNSAVPDMHFQTHYTVTPSDLFLSQLILGGGAAYKKIIPELVTGNNYITDADVTGISYMGFARASFEPITIKMQYLLGQNLTDLLQIGGYGISRIVDSDKGFVEYSPLKTQSYWIDIHTNGEQLQFGVFLARSENKGAIESLEEGTAVTGFGTDIKSLYRIAPRVFYNMGRARFALECEYTGAEFGTINLSENGNGIPLNTHEVNNFRILLGVYFFL